MSDYLEPFPKRKRGDQFGNLAEYRQGKPHRGQDWTVKEGSTIPAITSGHIHANGWSDGLGWYIVQTTAEGYFVLYAHLQHASGRSAGTTIVKGQPVGKVGNTGRYSTGSHLHLSVSKKPNVMTCAYNQLIDPIKLIEGKL